LHPPGKPANLNHTPISPPLVAKSVTAACHVAPAIRRTSHAAFPPVRRSGPAGFLLADGDIPQDGLVIVKGALGKVTNLAIAPLTPLRVVVV